MPSNTFQKHSRSYIARMAKIPDADITKAIIQLDFTMLLEHIHSNFPKEFPTNIHDLHLAEIPKEALDCKSKFEFFGILADLLNNYRKTNDKRVVYILPKYGQLTAIQVIEKYKLWQFIN